MMSVALNRLMIGVTLATALVMVASQQGERFWHRSQVWLHGGIWCSVPQSDGSVKTLYGQACTVRAKP